MSYEPFDWRLVQARLKDQVPTLRLVAGAADFAAVRGLRDFAQASAYVLMAREAGSPDSPRLARAVPAEAVFGVALAACNHRGERGEQAEAELRPLLGQVRAALIGWTPPVPGATACRWLQGAVEDYDDATLLWVDVYECTHVLQR